VLELKDKLDPAMAAPSMPAAAGGDGSLLAREALVELGWTLVDAERALSDIDEQLPVEEQVRAALRQAA
jgi:Holliday junction resolvasome RuvABC DNA-binding subunit